MPGHFGQFILSQDSTGLLIVSQKLPVSQVAEELLLIWLTSEPEEWINRIRSLPLYYAMSRPYSPTTQPRHGRILHTTAQKRTAVRGTAVSPNASFHTAVPPTDQPRHGRTSSPHCSTTSTAVGGYGRIAQCVPFIRPCPPPTNHVTAVTHHTTAEWHGRIPVERLG